MDTREMYRSEARPSEPAASPAQHRLWLLDQLDPGLPTYNVPWTVRLDGDLDQGALAAALTAAVARHEALRTTLRAEGDRLLQVVAPPEGVRLPVRDLRSVDDRWAAVRSHVMSAARRRFDLTRGSLFAAELLRVETNMYVLVLVAHHVVADGWSFGILFDELAAGYAAALNEGDQLSEPPIQYADLARRQNDRIEAGALDGAERYWLSELADAEPTLELPSELRRPAAQSFDGDYLDFRLGAAESDAVRRRAREYGATVFTVLLAAHAVLLSRLVGRDDLVVAVPVAGRTRPETERVVGLFMNTLPIRVRIDGRETFGSLVRRVSATMIRALTHQDVPFERIVELTRPPRDPARSPLAQVMFQLEELPTPRHAGGVEWRPELVDNRTSKLDLTLTMIDRPGELAGRLSYATSVVDEDVARDFVEAYRSLLGSLTRGAERPVGEHDGLSPRQRAAVTGAWADGGPAAAGDTDVLGLLQRTCTGTDVAVTGTDGSLSRDALLDQASRVAGALAGQGVRPDERVGLFLSRGTRMVAALLGVWWAGASYVPLDPTYPTDRLRAMITDSDVRVVLTDVDTRARLLRVVPPGFTTELITVEEAAAGSGVRRRPVPPEAAAYTIFTSGSTGRPKGVTVPRGAVTALVGAFAELLDIGPADRLVAVTTLSFDISVLELVLPLATGGRVIVADDETASDPEALRRLLVESGASVLQATPATWRMLLAVGGVPAGVRMLLCGGEALPRDLADQLAAPDAQLWNVYGPTETTVWSAAGPVPPPPAPVEVGPAIPGTRWYVLDDDLRAVPPGAVGQVYIGGAGVTRGYLGRPGLTADRFRPDPFGGRGARLYATGDVGRWRRSGRIELLGRADNQVKIRGFRIETEEVESVLRRHAGVADAVVVARTGRGGDSDQRLVGYVVPTAAMPAAEDLRAHLRLALPDYMVPTGFVELSALPRTPNGKIDRRALPEADWGSGHRAAEALPPRTPTEQRLARLWSGLLGLTTSVGVDDSFFALGGHSLSATQLVARVRADLGVTLPLRDLFTHPTIAGQAALVDQQRAGQGLDLVRVDPVQAATAPAPRTAHGRGDLLAELDALDDHELGDLLQTLIAEQQ